MSDIMPIILIGIALSMDTFSLSLGIGTFSISNLKAFQLSFIVGIMHFFMPIFGLLVGDTMIQLFKINCDLLLGVILLFIAIQMIIDLVKHEEEKFNLSLIGMILFAFGVSLDSFSVGLGLSAIVQNIYLATFIFAICSFLFTLSGIFIGKFASKLVGVYANIIGVVILLALSLTHLF